MRKSAPLVSKSDIVFAAALLAAAALCALLAWSRPAGASVVFRRDGEIVERLPLDRDAVFTIDGAYENVFEIRDGKARVIRTTCPNHQCERMGAISRSGSSIICAPNRTSASIEGGDGVDAYTG